MQLIIFEMKKDMYELTLCKETNQESWLGILIELIASTSIYSSSKCNRNQTDLFLIKIERILFKLQSEQQGKGKRECLKLL